MFYSHSDESIRITLGQLNDSNIDIIITDINIDMWDYNYGIQHRHAEIMMNDVEHGELFFEMTKPIESIYKSDSALKLRNKSVQPRQRAKISNITNSIRIPKKKARNDFHNTAGYLNMTMTGNQDDHKKKQNTQAVKVEQGVGPGSQNISGNLLQNKKQNIPKRVDGTDYQEFLPNLSTFKGYQNYEKMQVHECEKEKLLTESPNQKYDPKFEYVKESPKSYGFSKAKRLDLINKNEMPGPAQQNQKSLFNTSMDQFNDIKSVSFSRSNRFVKNNKLNPRLPISPRQESVKPSPVNSQFRKAEIDNVYFNEQDSLLLCKSEPAKQDQSNLYTDIGQKQTTQIHFDKDVKNLITKIDKFENVGPGQQPEKSKDFNKQGKFSKAKRKLQF